MQLFDAARGAHAKVKTDSSIFELDGLRDTDGLPFKELLVSDINISAAERATVVSCFNQFNYVFAFGHNPELSQVSITFSGFLVDDGVCFAVQSGKVIGDLVGFYKSNRVSKKRQVITLHAGTATIQGILVGMTIDGLNPELNMITATLTMLMLMPPSN